MTSVEIKNGKNRYKQTVLVNNWYEEKCDFKSLREDKPLNSNAHLYGTTYQDLTANVVNSEKFLQYQAVLVDCIYKYKIFKPFFRICLRFF